MKQETTVDFIIKWSNGNYWTRNKVSNIYRKNHLLALSFHTRADAERVSRKSSVIIKRICILEETKPNGNE